MQVVLVPIDNRPVTFVFPQMISKIACVEAIVPPREMMGSLTAHTDATVLQTWLNTTLRKNWSDGALVCMDSIIYGGLIPSRRTDLPSAEALDRVKNVRHWKQLTNRLRDVYIQSNIMRVSDNYDNVEEKPYWSRYGREIFAWSEGMHRLSTATGADQLRPGELEQMEARIPADIRQDYLETRRRNFQVNRRLIDFVESGDIDLLIFSQDDSGQFGLNVHEKERLLQEGEKRNLPNVLAYAGADEVLMTMLGHWLIQRAGKAPVVDLVYSPASGEAITSRYEGQTIGDSVRAQLHAGGLKLAGDAQPQFRVIIHTDGERQGDHIMLAGQPDLRTLNTSASAAATVKMLEESTVPCVICDVAYANGSDPILVEMLLEKITEKPELLLKLWGYAGWNTTGNTIGCALSMATARWFAEHTGRGPDAVAHLKNALFVRLSDDWAYQAEVRKEISNDLSIQKLHDLMTPRLTKISDALGYRPARVELALPWNRSFEVEIAVNGTLQPAR